MWDSFRKPGVRGLMIALSFMGMLEAVLCRPLHSGDLHHEESGRTACELESHDDHERAGQDHTHDIAGGGSPAGCRCPDGHDCDHCEGHHQVAGRTPRSLKGAAALEPAPAPAEVALPAPRTPRSVATELPDRIPQFLRAVQSTILLI